VLSTMLPGQYLFRYPMLVKAIPGTLRTGGAPFEPTHWSVVLLAAQSQSLEAAQSALANFCQAYWPPLYAFVRRRGLPPDDAQDCVQAFFAHLLEANTLSRACREKGHLRTFLLGSLQHFMAKDYHRANALKRGGGKEVISLDDCLVEAEAAALSNTHADETSCYDQAWAAALTRRAWTRLHDAFVDEGKGPLFEELKGFLSAGSASPPNQEEVATKLAIPVATLRTHLHRLRQRYRECLRAEVAPTVSSPGQIDEEMRYLYSVLLA
jgi:DNA-directed RNA polymerase specialized sigma24 family protein